MPKEKRAKSTPSPERLAMLAAFESVQAQYSEWITPQYHLWQVDDHRWGIVLTYLSVEVEQLATARNSERTLTRALHKAVDISAALLIEPATFGEIRFTTPGKPIDLKR